MQNNATQRVMPFGFAREMYVLHPAANESDVHDQLTARTAQLSAMLTLIGGGGLENFQGLSNELQDSYVAACAEMSREIEGLLQHATPRPAKSGKPDAELAKIIADEITQAAPNFGMHPAH